MIYEEAKKWCHVRSSIYRKAIPNIKYAKNHTDSFDSRISDEDKKCDDWEEWDPNEFYDTSLPAE